MVSLGRPPTTTGVAYERPASPLRGWLFTGHLFAVLGHVAGG